MGRLLPILLVLPVVAFGAWLLGRLARSDEDRARETLVEMVAEWNDMSVRGVTARLSDEFEARRDGRALAGKDGVADALRYFFAQEGDLLAGTMPWSAEADEETLVIDLDGRPPLYELTVRFRHAARPSPEPVWVVRVGGELSGDGDGFRVRTAELTTLGGIQLGGTW